MNLSLSFSKDTLQLICLHFKTAKMWASAAPLFPTSTNFNSFDAIKTTVC